MAMCNQLTYLPLKGLTLHCTIYSSVEAEVLGSAHEITGSLGVWVSYNTFFFMRLSRNYKMSAVKSWRASAVW